MPYGCRIDNKRIKTFVIEGGRLECPVDSPEKVFELLMSVCWLEDPNERPNFTKLLNDIRSLSLDEEVDD
jgi:hypothetical protein